MSRTCTRRALAALVALTGLTLAASATAGPWTRPLGSVYFKFGVSYFDAEESFVRGVSTGLAYDAVTYNLYTEIGLPARLTLIADLPYVVARNSAPSGFEYGNNTFGDGRFGLDFQLVDRWPISVGVETKVPLYESVARQGDARLIAVDGRQYPTSNFPDVGDDNVDVTTKLMAGWGFQPLFDGWVTAELGYRVRTGGYADGFWGAAGFGAFVWPRHIALGVYANGNINVQDDPNPEEQASAEFMYLQGYVLITAAPWQPGLGLTLAVGGVPTAVNSSQGIDFSIALSYEI